MRYFSIICVVYFLISGVKFAEETVTVYSTAEIRIDFGGPFSIRIEPGATIYRDLFPRPLQTIDFCPWHPQDSEVQQVTRPDTGFLCEMHVLRVKTVAEVMNAVRAASEVKRPDRGKNRDLTYSEIYGLKVIQWRFQAGKTRMDHYMLLGKKYNYLFVSSPYGSNGAIEAVLSQTALH